MIIHRMAATVLASLLPLVAAAQATTPAASSPAKKELVQKILQLQQPGIEQMARVMAEQTVAPLVQQAQVELQRQPAEKRDAIGKEMQADLKKYGDEVIPVLRDRAVKLAPSTVGAILEERFTEDELKQVVALLESPVNRKFQSVGGELQRALSEKLVAESRPLLEPKLRTLRDTMAKRLGITPPPASPTGAAPAKPAAAASR
ncbi:MAG: hypothetical protein ACKVQR_11235 [Aquabacterium sp.]